MSARSVGFSLAVLFFSGLGIAGPQTFTEVSATMGITGQDGLGHSVAWYDIDNDGDIDASFSNQDGTGFWLYRNDDTVFTDITVSSGLGGNGAARVLWGELTGDQYGDLVLAAGSSPKLFRNDDGTSFTNTTSGSGLTGYPVSVADFDNDGSLDILTLTSSGCSVLYNSGSGTFTPVTAGTGNWNSATCFDYDMDGDQDIYLGTYGDYPNALLRNDDSLFTDVTVQAGVGYDYSTDGITIGDYDNDGNLDMYLANYSSALCKLFQNNGDGTFTDVTTPAGVSGYSDTRTSAFVDYNNDGWLDIFSSHHDFYSYSNVMWRNNGDGTFTNVGVDIGLSGYMIGDYFGTAWGDYNLDGNTDLFAVGHIDKYSLFRNDMSETMPANYVVLELEGTVSNRDAIGAVVVADLGSLSLTRTVIGGEGYHDYHSLPIEFGLYDSPEIQTLEIQWPSGLVETYTDIPANQYIYAVEGGGLTGISSNPPPPTHPLSIECSPNPCKSGNTLSISFSGNTAEAVEINLYDLSGRIVGNIMRGNLTGKTQHTLWNAMNNHGERLAPGLYICKLVTASGGAVSEKVTILR